MQCNLVALLRGRKEASHESPPAKRPVGRPKLPLSEASPGGHVVDEVKEYKRRCLAEAREKVQQFMERRLQAAGEPAEAEALPLQDRPLELEALPLTDGSLEIRALPFADGLVVVEALPLCEGAVEDTSVRGREALVPCAAVEDTKMMTCREAGKLGAVYGHLGGRPRKKVEEMGS